MPPGRAWLIPGSPTSEEGGRACGATPSFRGPGDGAKSETKMPRLPHRSNPRETGPARNHTQHTEICEDTTNALMILRLITCSVDYDQTMTPAHYNLKAGRTEERQHASPPPHLRSTASPCDPTTAVREIPPEGCSVAEFHMDVLLYWLGL